MSIYCDQSSQSLTFWNFTSMLFWCHLPCWSGSVVLVWRPASDGFTQRVWPPVASRSRRSIVSDCWMGTKRFWPRNEEVLCGKFGWWIEDNWGSILKVSVKPSMIRATTQWQWTWSSWQWSRTAPRQIFEKGCLLRLVLATICFLIFLNEGSNMKSLIFCSSFPANLCDFEGGKRGERHHHQGAHAQT